MVRSVAWIRAPFKSRHWELNEKLLHVSDGKLWCNWAKKVSRFWFLCPKRSNWTLSKGCVGLLGCVCPQSRKEVMGEEVAAQSQPCCLPSPNSIIWVQGLGYSRGKAPAVAGRLAGGILPILHYWAHHVPPNASICHLDTFQPCPHL